MRRLAVQVRHEVRLVARNGEQLLLVLGIPLLLLVFFSEVDVLPLTTDDPVDFLAPGVLALAVMSTAMVSLGISTGFERGYHVLKRLAATPLGRPRLVASKAIAVGIVETIQFGLVVGTASLLGWRPGSVDWLAAAGAVVLGTLAFAGLGLALAGRLRAEVNLAAQNGVYLVLLLLGGMLVPVEELPDALAAVSRALPSGALADVLHTALGSSAGTWSSWVILAAWAVAAPIVASATFRWD